MFKNLNPSALGVSGHQSEIIELALTYGFTAIDLSITEFATRVRLKGMPYARRLLDSAKLRVGTFALPVSWDADDATFQQELKKLPEYAGCAAELKCSCATAVLAPGNDRRPYHENFEFHRQRFQEICSVFKPFGIRLAVGFQAAESLRRNAAFQFIHDLDALALLVDMTGEPAMGLLLDVWELYACGGSLENVRKIPVERIAAVQVADMPAETPLAELDDKCRWLPGAEGGRIDLVEFLMILREKGYAGPVTLKASRSAFQSRRRDLVVKQAGESLEKVWVAAGLPSTLRPVPTAPND